MILSVFSVSVVHVILYGCVLQGLHFCVMSLHDPGHDPVHLCAAGSSTAAEELHHLTAGGVLVQQRSPPCAFPPPPPLSSAEGTLCRSPSLACRLCRHAPVSCVAGLRASYQLPCAASRSAVGNHPVPMTFKATVTYWT